MSGASREEFKARMLNVARHLFLERGVGETSMSELAKALGVSKPTIYDTFGSKQALLDAVYSSVLGEADQSWIKESLVRSVSINDFLNKTAETYKTVLNSPHSLDPYLLVLREGSRSKDLVEAFNSQLVNSFGSGVQSILQRAIESGQCQAVDVAVVHKMIAAPMYFLMVDRALFGEHCMPLDRACAYIDASFEAIKLYLGVHEAERSSVGVSPPRAEQKTAEFGVLRAT